MSKSTATVGLGAATLQAGARKKGLVGALADLPATAGLGERIPVDDIVANPYNPNARSSDLDDLLESIPSVGLIHGLAICPADEFLEQYPEAELGESAQYVALAGNRRLAALKQLGRTHLEPDEYRIRSARDADETLLRLHENGHRVPLTPTQEALDYQRLAARGMSQRQIAKAAQVSQSHVAKRISLLQLPEVVRDVVDGGRLPIADALALLMEEADVVDIVANEVAQRLASESAPGVPDTGPNTLGDGGADLDDEAGPELIRLDLHGARHKRGVLRAEECARDKVDELGEGATFVPDIYERLGSRTYRNHLTNDKAIARALKEGTLLVAPGHWGSPADPRYYTSAEPAKGKRARTPHEEAELRDRRERKKAREGRREYLRKLAALKPSAPVLRDALLDHVLHGGGGAGQSHELGNDLAVAAGLWEPRQEGETWRTYRELGRTADAKVRALVAWVHYLTCAELDLVATYRSWGPSDVAYLERLRDLAGYPPTEWEIERMEAAKAKALTTATEQEEE